MKYSAFLQFLYVDCPDAFAHRYITGLGPDKNQNFNVIYFLLDGTTCKDGYPRTYEGLKNKCAANNNGDQPGTSSFLTNMKNWKFTKLGKRKFGYIFAYRVDLGPNPNFSEIKLAISTDFDREESVIRHVFPDEGQLLVTVRDQLENTIKNYRASTAQSASSAFGSGDDLVNDTQPSAETSIGHNSSSTLHRHPPLASAATASHQHRAAATVSYQHAASAAAASHYQHQGSHQHALAPHYQHPANPAAMAYRTAQQHALASRYQHPATSAAAATATARAKPSLSPLAPRAPLSMLPTNCDTTRARPTNAGRKRSLAETEAATAMAAAADLENGQCTQTGLAASACKTPVVQKFASWNDTIETNSSRRKYLKMPDPSDDELLGRLIEAGESEERSLNSALEPEDRSWAKGFFSPPEGGSCGSPFTGYHDPRGGGGLGSGGTAGQDRID